ncbi:MAG: DUF3575 domain-containing protein [Bacteroidetes bacterium]|nr:MAG: DUF3575 domain-containing protein [Bacteroidota bacterium]REK05225.1 MAG: DUF3575 domain-containing protein [Bacteroidota bacterium]REK32630.1 MAG: DUF3575 domain-containing protein [Bacteroidota bacterium]REK48923.1 MAG: DUF3575 domain-containing protein [Bacteroidota bacterium]
MKQYIHAGSGLSSCYIGTTFGSMIQVRFFILLMIALVCSCSVSGQDYIIKSNGDSLSVKVLDLKGDKIRFRMFNDNSGTIREVYKNQVSKIIYENGTELKIIYNMYEVSPDLYADLPAVVFKADLFAPLLNHVTFGVEFNVADNTNIEIKGGVIGPRISTALDKADGFLLKAGLKFVWTKDVIRRGLKYSHPFIGKYVKPELVYNQYLLFETEDSGPESRLFLSNYSIQLDFGNQLLIWNRFSIDYFIGLGYAIQTKSPDKLNARRETDYSYNYTHLYFGKQFPLALSAGITAGFVF